MDGIFARHDFLWNVHHGHTHGIVDPRNSRAISANGPNGHNGRDGKDGDMTNPPGSGKDGTDGTGSADAIANGAGLTFEHNPHNPAWTVTAITGHGGHGGNGGDAGTFPPDATYLIGNGGAAGTGGATGDATAKLESVTVFGSTGGTTETGIAVLVHTTTGHGGGGGNGGVVDGNTDTLNPGGIGGNGGAGGNAGNALAQLTNDIFKIETAAANSNDSIVTLTLAATGGAGGDGGDGGRGAFNGFAELDGAPGAGGNGGNADVSIIGPEIDLGGKTGGSGVANIVATAHGGNGGDGGDVPGALNGGHGAPGNGGSASIEMEDVLIAGGKEDDTVRIALNVIAGHGGTNGAGDLGSEGSTALFVHNCTFNGGQGVNTLTFAWDGRATASAVNVNLENGSFQIAGGPSNLLSNFQNVTGGRGFDALSGDNHANTLDGNGGDDLLIGAAGADRLIGGEGDDQMNGGAGVDTFVYASVRDSTGTVFDQITDLNFALDKIDVKFGIAGTGPTVVAMIFADTFDANMESAAHNLAKHHAMLLVSGGGSDFDGHTFLIADANGMKGYQAGHDLLIDITGAINVGQFSADLFV